MGNRKWPADCSTGHKRLSDTDDRADNAALTSHNRNLSGRVSQLMQANEKLLKKQIIMGGENVMFKCNFKRGLRTVLLLSAGAAVLVACGDDVEKPDMKQHDLSRNLEKRLPELAPVTVASVDINIKQTASMAQVESRHFDVYRSYRALSLAAHPPEDDVLHSADAGKTLLSNHAVRWNDGVRACAVRTLLLD